MMSVDPLMMTGSEASRSLRRPSDNSHQQTFEVEANSPRSPPNFVSPFSPRSPPHTHYQRGYNPVSSSESQYSNSSGGYRNPSQESTPPMQHNPNAGYFDLPLHSDRRISQASSQVSPQARRPSHHGRNWSDASDQSQVSQISSNPVELDAGKDGDRRSSLQRALQGLGMGRMLSRRRSEPVPLAGGPKPEWTPSPREALGHIPEAGESHIQLESTINNVQFGEISLLAPEEGYARKGERNHERGYYGNEHENAVFRDRDRGF